MALDSKTLSYFQELEALKMLGEAQNKALMDLLVFAVLADREVTDEELAQLDDELTRLPFVWDSDVRDRVVEHAARTREFLENHADDEQRLELFVRELGETLSSSEQRLVALRMFAAVVLADGLASAERERIFEVGRAFAIESETIDQAIAQVAESMKL